MSVWARSVICQLGTDCVGPPMPDVLPKALWRRHLYVLLESHNWWRYNYLNVSKQCWFSWKQRTRFTQCYSRTVRPTTKTKAKVLYNIILFIREITLFQWPPRDCPKHTSLARAELRSRRQSVQSEAFPLYLGWHLRTPHHRVWYAWKAFFKRKAIVFLEFTYLYTVIIICRNCSTYTAMIFFLSFF